MEADDLDLAAARTRDDLRQLLRRLWIRSGKPSFREMERRLKTNTSITTKYRHSSLHEYIMGGRYPSSEGLFCCVIACGQPEAVARQWTAAWSRIEGLSTSPTSATASDKLYLRLPLTVLLARYELKNHPAPVAILRGEPTWPGDAQDDVLRNVLTMIEDILAVDGVVEAVPRFHGLGVRVASAKEFLAVLAADMVVRPAKQDPGSRLWLIEQSQKILKGDDETRTTQLSMVWSALFDLLRRGASGPRTAWPIEEMVHNSLEKAEGSSTRFSSVIGLIFRVVRDDRVLREKLHQALVTEERALPRSAKPELRHQLGKLRSLARTYNPSDGYDFARDLRDVPPGALCRYRFEATRYPLTMGDAARLLPDLKLPEGRAGYPYLIELPRPVSDEALTRHLAQLLKRCNDVAYQTGKMWAIPTAAEWVALAGCEESAFPWGSEPPDPHRANLTYSWPEGGRLQPVGTLPAGRSPHDIHDCCGNVHEIVEWRRDPTRRADYRLAGESFRSWAEYASCRHLRHLTQSPSSRGNVGIRLVRIALEDEAERWVAHEALAGALDDRGRHGHRSGQDPL
ncbi:hypothetical protein AB0K12_39605 [Nonomuraea sp. NPDC049419]|uniref:hypothetical protein n=1 Tax=Nonomuraea sp. NPDC049419 TaxID=3155772 RepID=UPI0034360FBF